MFRLRLWPASSEDLAPGLLLGIYWPFSACIVVHSWCDVITGRRSISRPRFLRPKSKHSNIECFCLTLMKSTVLTKSSDFPILLNLSTLCRHADSRCHFFRPYLAISWLFHLSRFPSTYLFAISDTWNANVHLTSKRNDLVDSSCKSS